MSEQILSYPANVTTFGHPDDPPPGFKVIRLWRFADTDLVPASTPRRPATAPELLNLLAVADRPVGEQRAAVARWLAANEPLPILLASLEPRGLC